MSNSANLCKLNSVSRLSSKWPLNRSVASPLPPLFNGVPLLRTSHISMRSFILRSLGSLFIITFLVVLYFLSLWHSTIIEWQKTGTPSYRATLSTLRPTDFRTDKSRTLSVANKIYVLNLAKREDRRQGMKELARAMELDFTFFNGTDLGEDKNVEEMRWVLDHVREWRSLHRINKTAPNKDPENFQFTWAEDVGRDDELGSQLKGAELWTQDKARHTASSAIDSPVLDTYDEFGKNWGSNPLRPPQLACWNSHYRLLRTIADGDDEIAIVFEDDIDMEWDSSDRLRAMWPALDEVQWDIVMLGHCHSQEWHHPPLRGSPFLHQSKHVLCTHAYAVNREGARKMVRYLRSEAFAYSRTVDHAFQHLQSRKKINSYSVYPPIVVQTYDMGSDIIPGRTNKDRSQWLQDSAMERIALGKQFGESVILE